MESLKWVFVNKQMTVVYTVRIKHSIWCHLLEEEEQEEQEEEEEEPEQEHQQEEEEKQEKEEEQEEEGEQEEGIGTTVTYSGLKY